MRKEALDINAFHTSIELEWEERERKKERGRESEGEEERELKKGEMLHKNLLTGLSLCM